MFARTVGLLYITLCMIGAGYNTSIRAQTRPSAVSASFDFRNGSLGWQAGFAEYPPATNTDGSYQLAAEMRNLPSELGVNGTGFYIQGINYSDDLFMFLKRRLTSADGIVPGQTYQINFTLVFASNEQTGCRGIGGSPGDNVYLKAGATPAEPLTLLDRTGDLQMNVDKGAQANGGIAASVTGTIANGILCDSAPTAYVSVQRSYQHTSFVNANSKGELWLLVGTDSAYDYT